MKKRLEIFKFLGIQVLAIILWIGITQIFMWVPPQENAKVQVPIEDIQPTISVYEQLAKDLKEIENPIVKEKEVDTTESYVLPDIELNYITTLKNSDIEVASIYLALFFTYMIPFILFGIVANKFLHESFNVFIQEKISFKGNNLILDLLSYSNTGASFLGFLGSLIGMLLLMSENSSLDILKENLALVFQTTILGLIISYIVSKFYVYFNQRLYYETK